MKTGVILIGQTPRQDYEEYLRAHLPDGARLDIRGALDELSSEIIQNLPQNTGEEILTTLDKDGSQITVAARHIHQRIPCLIKDLETKGADFIVLLCTGEFPLFHSHVPLLFPSRILTLNAVAMAPNRTVSVIVPLAKQCEQLAQRWSEVGVHPVMHVLSPFQEYNNLENLSQEIMSHAPALVVLDCMGYSATIKNTLQKETNLPVLAARTLLGHVLQEITF